MKVEGDYLVFADGKKVYANRGIVGLGMDEGALAASEGCDGGLSLTRAQARELARYMVGQWMRYWWAA